MPANTEVSHLILLYGRSSSLIGYGGYSPGTALPDVAKSANCSMGVRAERGVGAATGDEVLHRESCVVGASRKNTRRNGITAEEGIEEMGGVKAAEGGCIECPVFSSLILPLVMVLPPMTIQKKLQLSARLTGSNVQACFLFTAPFPS